MPASDCAATACDCVASGERSKATAGVVRSVLEEDVMLGLGTQVRHVCVKREPAAERAVPRGSDWDGAKRDLSDAQLINSGTRGDRTEIIPCTSMPKDTDAAVEA
jgi:hypothetical protein